MANQASSSRGPGLLSPPSALSQQTDAGSPVEGQSRGRGGGRRRGRGSSSRASANLNPARAAGPPPPAPAGAPRPMYLQTEGTPEKNDPLWTTGLAGAELQAMPNTEYVYSGFEGLPEVISVMYATCISSSVGFSHRVPESVFAYYCAVCSYARMLHLHGMNSLFLNPDEERFVAQFRSLELEIPMLLAHYLAGFGNTRVPSGRDIKFRLVDRPEEYTRTDNVRGWFGRVSRETQVLYQLYPCLAVYAARIQADLSPPEPYSRAWDFPLAIVPADAGGLGPSSAMLGYSSRNRLSQSQLAYIESLNVYGDEDFPSANPGLPLNLDLLNAVCNELRQVKTIRLSHCPWSIVGSQAQIGRVRVENEFASVTPKSQVFQAPYKLPVEISFPASAFCYRIDHDYEGFNPDEHVAPWVVWRYTQGANAWAVYAGEVIDLREREPEFLQITEFRTTPYLVRARLEALERALGVG